MLHLLVAALLLILWALPVSADWLCDGDRLQLERVAGAVDVRGLAGGIPNSSDGTLPGDGILLTWRGTTLQLPRTNNAGPPSYTDGRWWWREPVGEAPELLERRGDVIEHACEPLVDAPVQTH
ncbi:hypothetical protein KR49_01415 [Synechococcus sp. KORDI-49]|uniref:hypothetical protein n=1 Tax=Synechococcus sp. KORDI-49 TaxID=585423 RepID=UPI0004E09E5C|nr:hypothetical protein KR49_01415 [Synechococcus sp. KORDI-49]